MPARCPIRSLATIAVATALLVAGCGGLDSKDADPKLVALTGDAAVLDFGERRVGDTADALALLSNCCIGPEKVRALSGIQVELQGAGLAVGEPCAVTRLEQATSCTIGVRWQPQTAGPLTGTLTVRADPPAPVRQLVVRGLALP